MKKILCISFCFCANTSFAINYYFSQTSGNDNHTSVQAQNPLTPWKSIAKFNTASLGFASGDSVFFKRGDIWKGITLEPKKNGLKIGAYGLGDLPVIDGGANVALKINHSSRIDFLFEELSFKRSGATGIVAELGAAWSDLYPGMMNSIIRNCSFFGTVVMQGSYNLFENNLVDGATNNGNGNGIWEHHGYCHHNVYRGNTVKNFTVRGIWTMIDTHDGLFEGNTVSNCKMAGIDLDGADYVVYNHQVKNNTIFNIANDAIEIENAFDCLVSGNYMYGGGRCYIYIINYPKCKILNGHGATNGIGAILNTTVSQNTMIGGGVDYTSMAIGVYKAGGINFYHNSVYNFKSRFFDLDYISPSEVTKIKLKNNIFSVMKTPSWYGMVNFSTNDYNVLDEDDNNCFYNCGRNDIYADRQTGKQKSLNQYRMLTGKGKNSIIADPGFISEIDLNLQFTSPCINAGISIGQSYIGPAPDMGAHESPYTNFHVLPSWNLSFNAQKRTEGTLLEWSARTDNPADHFDLERSEDGIVFITLATFYANGSGNSENFFYLDFQPQSKNHYRLKFSDANGHIMYSEVLFVEYLLEKKILIYPNPVTGRSIRLTLSSAQASLDVTVYSQLGQTVLKTKLSAQNQSAQSTFLLTLPLAPGRYFIRVRYAGTDWVGSFLKLK